MFYLAVIVVLSGYLVTALIRRRKFSCLPPSPPGFPLLGNLFQMPSKLLFLKLDEWKEQLGDIFSLDLAGQKIVVLANAKLAADVLDRTSNITSDRPTFVMSGEIMTGGLLLPFMQHGDRWRTSRRFIHEGFNIRAAEAYHGIQEDEALHLIRALQHDHSNIQQCLHHSAASAIWRALLSGPSIGETEAQEVARIDNITEALTKAAFPMAFMVDIIPVMKYLPTWAAAWKKYGTDFFNDTDAYFMGLLKKGRAQKEGFIANSAEYCQRFGVEDRQAAWHVGMIFGAGVETTATATHYFVLAMVLHPEAVRKAQLELDAVCGNRPPTFADRKNLPYVQAVLKETLRWRTPAPAGFPHVASQSFTYKDYIIPKGTLIIGNIWSINRDPKVFPDFEAFRPERYLDSSGQLNEALPDYHEDLLAFGTGRRVCPGVHFASNSLFISMASLLWAFEFRKARDENGLEITPSATEFVDSGTNVNPAPFRCELVARQSDLDGIRGDAAERKSGAVHAMKGVNGQT